MGAPPSGKADPPFWRAASCRTPQQAAADSGHGVTVSVAAFVTPPPAAEMLTAVFTGTALVVTVNVVLVAPSGTVTVPGTAAAALLLASVTGIPPTGAGPVSVTV